MANAAKRQIKGTRLDVILALPFAHCASRKLSDLPHRARLSSVKTRIERDVGILPDMYYLTYLDSAPLDESLSLRDHDVVSGATLRVRPWRTWYDLLESAYLGKTQECLSGSMDVCGPSEWSRHCAWAALFVASHRGHYGLAAKLLESTRVGINRQSSRGWTALHAAARTGQWKALCVLVDNGADVRIRDKDGMSAFDLARSYGNKKCEQSLNFCQWNLQKHRIVRERKTDYDARKARMNASRRAHQFRDSTVKTWREGSLGRVYMMQTPNSVGVGDVARFEREKKASKLRESDLGWRKELLVDQTRTTRPTNLLPSLNSASPFLTHGTTSPSTTPKFPSHSAGTPEVRDKELGEKLDFNYGWFDPLRAQQLIPPTHDVITYSNPSSCQLRPKSLLNPEGYTTPPTANSRASSSHRTINARKSLAQTV